MKYVRISGSDHIDYLKLVNDNPYLLSLTLTLLANEIDLGTEGMESHEQTRLITKNRFQDAGNWSLRARLGYLILDDRFSEDHRNI